MKTNTHNKFGSLLTGVLLTSVAALPAAVIDQFLSPVGGQGVTISNGIVGATQSSVQTGLPDVLGGSRELSIRIQAVYDLASLATANVNGPSTNDQFALANSPNVDSSAKITWDANAGGMNANLSMDNRFNMINVFNDIAIAYTLTMETFGGGISTQTVNTGANFEGDVVFNFGGFVGGASLTDIDRITLSFESGRSADVSIGSIVTVPEPASAGLVVLSGLGLMLRRRRA